MSTVDAIPEWNGRANQTQTDGSQVAFQPFHSAREL